MQLQVVPGAVKKTRKRRTPNFPIAGTMSPFGIYPIAVHPVLPGETLKSASIKWRCSSMPIKNPFSGAWLETWAFYVKLTDLDRTLAQSFVSDTVSTTGYTAGSDQARYFTKSGKINWIEMCMDKIVSSYFRDEDEADVLIDGVHKAKLNAASWYQNLVFKEADAAVDTTSPSDMYEQMNAWAMLRQMNMVELEYEDYLEQYGVKSPQQSGDPEILRYARSWTQPKNVFDPTDGSPSSAWVWSDEIKADKDKMFKEPGFLVFAASVRPKMFNKRVTSSLIGNMWGLTDWFPAYNLDDPTAGAKVILTDDSVFDAATNGADLSDELWYDHRDLLSHGEQFINNYAPPHALPFHEGMNTQSTASVQAMRGQYADDSAIASLFVSATSTDQVIEYEGIVNCLILGHITDTTKG